MEIKFSAGVWAFDGCGDRFLLSGYRDGKPVVERIKKAASIPGLSGVELNYPADVTDANLDEVEDALKANNLQASIIGVDHSGQRRWQFGSLAAADAIIRGEAVTLAQRGMDVAARLGANQVNIWLGQDGFDYCFQVDYLKSWRWLVESLKEIAGYRSDVRVCVEYKPKEPRTHAFINNAAKALLLVQEVGLNNIGVTIDVGHSLNAGENVAEALALLAGYGKMFHFHFNDNYRSWDDDLLVGSVHLVEYIELLYWLQKVGYDGWYSLDVFPYREDPVQVCRESIATLKGILNLIERLGVNKLDELIAKGDAIATLSFIRQHIMP
ncbi:sugar phosphate isomerase/epimerase family protein [Neomoorella thermoacetica]|uniref:sugar phosphate isomerase/epimerase family protein n=1 Tax=Neomoorella thermoacetica TaxID=1525 RepID=UPI0008FB2717|nr:sugar phosphate isomerase/epimerase family protein [Moorella thermoacetica]APC09196.1 xylose isomerase [Moorella thermoacetica]